MTKRIMLMCISLIMVFTCAAAENKAINLGGDGCDQMKFACTLPDGRMVFCGSRGTVGNYNESRARLLCLNPDWSVSWEYFDTAEGMGRYAFGTLLTDGTIGVIYYNAPYQETQAIEIRKFTQEGEPTGEPVDLIARSDDIPNILTSRWFVQTFDTAEGGLAIGFIGWDGGILFSIPTRRSIWMKTAIDAGDGVVLTGSESFANGLAKIMKMDYEGNILWETVLPLMSTTSDSARIQECIRTSDGGYLGWIAETGPEYDSLCYALVRFNENGRVLWTNREAFADRTNMMCQDMIEYNGRYVFLELPDFSDFSEKAPRVYHWFGADGTKLGETQLWIPREDAKGVTDWDTIRIVCDNMLVTADGLWSLYSVGIDDDKDIRKEMDSLDDILYRVPELPE